VNEPHLQPQKLIGRYALYDEIASGGMATVYFGRLLGPVGFSRTVAIKSLHAHFAKDPEFVSMFLDEARLAARVQHPNVVSTMDVVATDGELFLVMEYVQGESLARLARNAQKAGFRMPPRIALTIATGMLYGLHAAHEARNERGEPLGIVHRDISPQNVMVGIDGVSRVLDFGVAKAAGRLQTTNDGQLKGKVAYMSPEQILGHPVDRRTDIYAASVVLWETLTGRRMFEAENPASMMNQILDACIEMPSRFTPGLHPELDALLLRGLSHDPSHRFATAREMAMAIEQTTPVATTREVGDWVMQVAGDSLGRRANMLAEIESVSTVIPHLPPLGAQSSAGARPRSGADAVSGEAGSQATGLSLSTDSFSAAQTRRRTLLMLAGMAAGGLLIGIIAALIVTAGRPRPAPPVSAATVESVAQPVVVPPVVDPPEVEPAVSVASAVPSAPPPPSARPTAKTVRPIPVPTQPPPPVKKCNPPYTVDANGIKRPKPECF
jgi:serine/threonine-protein kinase